MTSRRPILRLTAVVSMMMSAETDPKKIAERLEQTKRVRRESRPLSREEADRQISGHGQLRREIQLGLHEIERGEVAPLDMAEIKRKARAPVMKPG